MTTSAGKSELRGCLIVLVVLIVWVSIADIVAMYMSARAASEEIQSFSGATMGTRYSVRYSTRSSEPDEDLQRRVDERLAEINRLMSTYDPESELSKFNEYNGDDWFAVSAETALVVEFALQIAAESGGAFDPTVGPLVNLWGFGPEKDRVRPPAEAELTEAMAVVGFGKIDVRTDPPALRKAMPELYLDLSAIAKGYAVDEISELLKEAGHSNSMVEIGGEVRTRGTKPGDVAWRIGVEKPESAGRSLQQVIELRDAALATSGDYRNFFEHNGVRYSHTIDPTTGRPVEHQLATVTVLADSCMEADALATAVLVMGSDRGYNWCVEREIAALLMIRDEDGLRERATPKFLQLKTLQASPE